MAIKALIKNLLLRRQLETGWVIIATFTCKCEPCHFHTRLIKKITLMKHRLLIDEERGTWAKAKA